MSSTQSNSRALEHPCKLCGAPAGMTCLEYEALRQVNAAFDRIEATFTTVADRMDRVGVVA